VSGDVRPFRTGTRVLHIGPHKTGTTTLQAACHHSREGMAAQGVHYAGPNGQPMAAAIAAAQGRALPTHAEAATDRWQELLEEIRASTADRVLVSSEFFADAPAERVPAITEALDPARLEVVVTLRPLVKILPSQWQQYMQNRMVIPYASWLEEQLIAESTTVTPSFWRRHRHDRLVRRWVDVVGVDRLTVVVVDDRDKQMLTSTFEQLLALRPGTLRSEGSANRSLTWVEVEMLRAFNQLWRDRGWSEADYTALVRFGAARHLQQRRPGPEEERLRTPQWAVDRAVAIQKEMLADIEATGVRIIGEPALLTAPGAVPEVGDNAPVTEVPVDIAARLSAGLVRSLSRVPRHEAAPGRVVGPIEAAAKHRPGRARPGAPAGRALAGSRGARLRRLVGRLRDRLRAVTAR
jgi:hypothetical protein